MLDRTRAETLKQEFERDLRLIQFEMRLLGNAPHAADT
jgi:hypothetical protein